MAEEKHIVDQINVYRQSKNLVALVSDDFIANLAREHSQNMADKKVPFSHQNVQDRLKKTRDHFEMKQMAGSENVYYSKPMLGDAVESWKKSQNHNKNMLGPYNYCGIGYVHNIKTAEHYVTAIFANVQKPKVN